MDFDAARGVGEEFVENENVASENVHRRQHIGQRRRGKGAWEWEWEWEWWWWEQKIQIIVVKIINVEFFVDEQQY
jgi:hypothetical protein